MSHRSIMEITREDLQRIHWKHYLTRKVIILGTLGICGFVIEHYFHLWMFGKGGELIVGEVASHLLLGVPLMEKESEEVAEALAKRAR